MSPGLFTWDGFFFSRLQEKKFVNLKYNISFITHKEKKLPTEYIAEILDLSIDRFHNLFLFDLIKAKENILKSPLIKEVRIEKIKPAGLFIDYKIKKPIAIVLDYENMAIDENGYVFPFSPYYDDQDLPKIFIGLLPFKEKCDAIGRVGADFNIPLSNKNTLLALELLQLLRNQIFANLVQVKKIDVSLAYEQSYGKREIIIELEDYFFKENKKFIFPKIVRLGTNNYKQQMDNLINLIKKMKNDYELQLKDYSFSEETIKFDPKIIDLRISKIALIDNN